MSEDTQSAYDKLKWGSIKINPSQFTMLPLSQIELNEGQLPGLPANPRSIKKKKYEKLKKDIADYPEMLSFRCMLVYPLNDESTRFIVIGGNMRHRVLTELKATEVPCYVIPRDVSVERLQAYTILDNNNFGEWDWDMLANEWDDDLLSDWGINIPGKDDKDKDLSDRINLEYKIEVDCADENDQEKLFNYLQDQGYKCRLLTL